MNRLELNYKIGIAGTALRKNRVLAKYLQSISEVESHSGRLNLEKRYDKLSPESQVRYRVAVMKRLKRIYPRGIEKMEPGMLFPIFSEMLEDGSYEITVNPDDDNQFLEARDKAFAA